MYAAGVTCSDCHMPATTYMGVDDRRDHSFRAPDAGKSAEHYGSVTASGRSGDGEAALGHLRRAAELAPDAPWFAYVYGVALNSTGNAEDAVEYLAGARKRFPDDFDIAWALAEVVGR